MSLSPGATLGPYAILAELGHGGMGVVLHGPRPTPGPPGGDQGPAADLTRDDTAKQRFLQEGQAASALDHPNICTIYERSTRRMTARLRGLSWRRDTASLRGDQLVEILAVVAQWRTPDHRYFKVRTADDTYTLRHDVTSDGWEVTELERHPPR